MCGVPPPSSHSSGQWLIFVVLNCCQVNRPHGMAKLYYYYRSRGVCVGCKKKKNNETGQRYGVYQMTIDVKTDRQYIIIFYTMYREKKKRHSSPSICVLTTDVPVVSPPTDNAEGDSDDVTLCDSQ